MRLLYLTACLLAALLPWISADEPSPRRSYEDLAWPERLFGAALVPVALTPVDRKLAANLPGELARFAAGERHVLLRRLREASRHVHSVEPCMRGSGFTILPQPDRHVSSENPLEAGMWSSFLAVSDAEQLRVLERVVDGNGRVFSDVSAWYWSAALGSSPPPYLCLTVVERLAPAARHSVTR